jgi:hypothetical protein
MLKSRFSYPPPVYPSDSWEHRALDRLLDHVKKHHKLPELGRDRFTTVAFALGFNAAASLDCASRQRGGPSPHRDPALQRKLEPAHDAFRRVLLSGRLDRIHHFFRVFNLGMETVLAARCTQKIPVNTAAPVYILLLTHADEINRLRESPDLSRYTWAGLVHEWLVKHGCQHSVPAVKRLCSRIGLRP